MQERLQKIISAAGIASRRAAEKLISDGRVKVNGQVSHLGDSADVHTDVICVDGKTIAVSEEKTYIMLHKPRGYVTTLSDEKGRRTVAALVQDAGERLYPVGRLDMDSEGLLLMTNDGELANRLMHPSHEVHKTYETTVSGGDIKRAIDILKEPIDLDGYTVRAVSAGVKETGDGKSVLSITIREGRNRQVRKMCAAAGLQVHRLVRVREGGLELGSLPVGKWRYLSENEISMLREIK